MLELGYEREVTKVLDALQKTNHKRRQSLLLSATLTQGIEQLSEVSLRHPVFIDAAGDGGEDDKKNLVTPANLKQAFLLVPAKLRLVALGRF
ncbi:ATP-dependent RNA helicase dbp7 isoform X2 [Eurytemora carolleeae]|uniref:ATP-dependent RNA helicase dbp7 isoform X1 n=1 Tax=Eurytemora carolleeae TaxID=1294199 RepID=UPI000C768E49|nr:ATP-dependent RNA helicase dbp7 isoform X1 [Eurytemora carolleeae]XP_023346786.1 ATP-dependent RNA helicase dbp7 isoform X2 [Eurytemora carolleeae]|eukprot:XP_023346785.1 ATP-dependent RNA helicase dbp7-like isoform X1 [Eurytemora affinis]